MALKGVHAIRLLGAMVQPHIKTRCRCFPAVDAALFCLLRSLAYRFLRIMCIELLPVSSCTCWCRSQRGPSIRCTSPQHEPTFRRQLCSNSRPGQRRSWLSSNMTCLRLLHFTGTYPSADAWESDVSSLASVVVIVTASIGVRGLLWCIPRFWVLCSMSALIQAMCSVLNHL